MASVYKRKRDKASKLASWYIACADADGIRRTVKGCTDRAATEQMARKLETEAELRRRGLIDPRDEQFAADEAVPLGEHLEAWRLFSLSVNNGERHANEGFARVRNLMAMAKATRLSDLSLARMQAALNALKNKNRSLRTIHHHASLAKNFAKWAWHDGRTREDLLAH